MASMRTGVATLAAVPASLRSGSLASSVRSCPASSAVLLGQKKSSAVLMRRSAVVSQGSSSDQGNNVWNVARNAAAAAAISLVLSASPVLAKEDSAFPGFPDNSAGAAARNILEGAKQKADQSFAQAQRTGEETTGQAISGGESGIKPAPAISQVNPNAEEASDPFADKVAAKADLAADVAPGTAQQRGEKYSNPIEKAFSTPSRGLNN